MIISIFSGLFFFFIFNLFSGSPPPPPFFFSFLWYVYEDRFKNNHFYSLCRTSLGDQIKWAGTFNPLLQRLCAWTVTRQLWPDMIIGFGIMLLDIAYILAERRDNQVSCFLGYRQDKFQSFISHQSDLISSTLICLPISSFLVVN